MYFKIIQRARYNYLVSRLRDQTQSLTPVIIANVEEAFTSYLRSKLEPSLSVSDGLKLGTELLSWPEIFSRVKTDAPWTKTCTDRDEKFTMHASSLVSRLLFHIIRSPHNTMTLHTLIKI